jgi:iron(III) transport system permease protein
VLPQLRPAIGAGSLLVVLYVLSDFGAVSLMRYSTFTRAVYLQYQAAFDRTPAAILGLVLVALTVLVLVLEARYAGGRVGAFRPTRASTTRRPTVLRLGRWRWPAAALCLLVVLVALVLPLTVIVWWLVRGLAAGEPLRLTFVAAANSLRASALGAAAAVAGAFPVALWAARYPGRVSRLVERASFTGYALPGIVVALSLVFFGIRVAPALYQSLLMLVFAYIVLFLPQAGGAVRASLLQIHPALEEAAGSLGAGRLRTVRRVILPLVRPGLAAGWALVFLTAMKELPATLLLAPTGFRTLATEVWSATNAAFFDRAAPPALAIVLASSVPLAVLVMRERADR